MGKHRPQHNHVMSGQDPHADKRDRAREKAIRGHAETGRSVRLINEIMGKRATGELPAQSTRRKGKRT